ncbi:hypothetical protein [Halobacillus sp. B23F22_1]|uniref:hypothetical protein n=1 Tax=Halobacillus sp. B23F22_1 TaxID=3459514 RepID=UPI00373FAE2F
MRNTPVNIQQCEGFWNCVSPDAWVTGIGTFFGAFIAGIISIAIFKSQIKHENKKGFRNEYNTLMKFNETYKRLTSPFTNNLRLIVKGIQNEDYGHVIELVEVNTPIVREINKIDTSNLSYQAERKVILLNRAIEIVHVQLVLFSRLNEENGLKHLDENLSELRSRMEDLDNYENLLKRKI